MIQFFSDKINHNKIYNIFLKNKYDECLNVTKKTNGANSLRRKYEI
jgi:hypothetical protein